MAAQGFAPVAGRAECHEVGIRNLRKKFMRDYLVFVRAGKHSLHSDMLAAEPDRNWDCCVNGWDESVADDAAAEYNIRGSMNKFEAYLGIADEAIPLKACRYVLMIDDDLRSAPGDVSRFFRLCEQHRLYLSQPAMALGSHANHLVNIRNPACTVRNVSFVEGMAPCFSQAALDALRSTFLLTRCTWSIDYAWSSIFQGKDLISVVDALEMRHTKPMDHSGGPFYKRLRSQGIDPDQELASVHRRFASFGPMQTLEAGHRYRWPLPAAINQRLAASMEHHKIDLHLRRNGTIAGWEPQVGPDGRYAQVAP